MSDKSKKINTAIKAADSLSLGISIVVAILMGFGIGWGLKELTGSNWGLGIGIVIGVGAAINNIYKAYKSQVKSYAEFNKKQNRDEI